MEQNKIAIINELLYQELERLSNDQYMMTEDFDKKMKRSTAIQKTALSIVRVAEAGIKVMDSAERNATSVQKVENYLGLKLNSKKDK